MTFSPLSSIRFFFMIGKPNGAKIFRSVLDPAKYERFRLQKKIALLFFWYPTPLLHEHRY